MSELNDTARAFVDATRFAEDPTDSDAARVRSALAGRIAAAAAVGAATTVAAKAAAAGTGTATGVGSAGSTALPIGMLLKYVGIGTLVGAAAIGGTVAAPRLLGQSAVASQTATQATVAAPTPSSTPVRGTVVQELPAMVETAEPTLEQSPAVAKPFSPARSARGSGAPTPQRSTLDEEIPLIRDAQAAVRAGQWSRAEGLLNEHASRFPAGIMSEDRAALRVFVLCASGRGEGRGSAERFVASHPRSPYAGQVASSCGLTPAVEQENK